MKRPKPLVSAPIIIQESQISKTIRSNDSAIGGRFGNYKFAHTVNFRIRIQPTSIMDAVKRDMEQTVKEILM